MREAAPPEDENRASVEEGRGRWSLGGREDITPSVGQRASAFLPMFILIPGFKVQEGWEEFEEFIKGQSEGIREIKKVPVTSLKKCKVNSDHMGFVALRCDFNATK